MQTHPLGPRLCYSVGRDGISIKDGYNVKNKDTVIFCFGEIDCRCHVHKHITESQDYKNIIDVIVKEYFEQIKRAVDDFDELKTVIYNVVPPIQKHNTFENPSFPYLGTDEERQKYVRYFNEALRKKCIEYDFVYFDVYNDYIDENGYLEKTLSDGNVHIRESGSLKRFIDREFI